MGKLRVKGRLLFVTDIISTCLFNKNVQPIPSAFDRFYPMAPPLNSCFLQEGKSMLSQSLKQVFSDVIQVGPGSLDLNHRKKNTELYFKII